MRILILGASGFIGKNIREHLGNSKSEVYGTYCTHNSELEKDDSYIHYDMDSVKQMNTILQMIQPNIIISSLRGDFTKQLEAHKTIANYVQSMKGSRMIYISTANVFDNDLSCMHTEEHETNPESEYGLYKATCEKMLMDMLGDKAVIIRIPSVWGRECPRIKQLKNLHKPLHIWDNLMMNYTTAEQIAKYISYIIDNDLKGIFHIGSIDMMDYMEFYREIIKILCIDEPDYEIEHLPDTCYQAVLSSRTDLPSKLQLTVEDIIQHCK